MPHGAHPAVHGPGEPPSVSDVLDSKLEVCYMCPIQVVSTGQLEIRFRTWGGRRRGAGRKPSGRKVGVPHRPRPLHERRHPVHVTLRADRRLPSLREERLVLALRRGLARASRCEFRILQFSIQTDHVHLMVEAEDRSALSRGVQGLGIRLAKAVNSVLGRRGKVWTDRFHARPLRSPREVRNGLVYVLQNWRKHLPAVGGIDPCSSAPWFTGWRKASSSMSGSPPVYPPRTWLAAVGWQRHGLIGLDEAPATPKTSRRTSRDVRIVTPPAALPRR